MSIQNISGIIQATQPIRAGSGKGVEPAVANVQNTNKLGVTPELPQIAIQQADSIKPTATQLQSMVDSINKAIKPTNKNLEFSVDTDTKKLVVKLMDTETGDVIRQFPSEEVMAISRSIDRIQQGLLLKQKA